MTPHLSPVAAVLATLLAFVALTPPAPAQSVMTFQNRTNGRTLSVHATGTVEASADARRVERLGRGGRLSIETAAGGTTRRVEMTPDPDGGVRQVYSVDGRVRPLDPEGHAWMERAVEAAVLDGGIDAPHRAARLLRTDGLPSALAWAERYRSDGARAAHVRSLLTHTASRPADAARVLDRGVRGVRSDGDRRRLLLHAFRQVGLDARAVREAYFRSASAIRSDGDLRDVLLAPLAAGSPTREVALGVLGTIQDIRSDGDRVRVLLAVPDALLSDRDVARAYRAAALATRSDRDRVRALARQGLR